MISAFGVEHGEISKGYNSWNIHSVGRVRAIHKYGINAKKKSSTVKTTEPQRVAEHKKTTGKSIDDTPAVKLGHDDRRVPRIKRFDYQGKTDSGWEVNGV